MQRSAAFAPRWPEAEAGCLHGTQGSQVPQGQGAAHADARRRKEEGGLAVQVKMLVVGLVPTANYIPLHPNYKGVFYLSKRCQS